MKPFLTHTMLAAAFFGLALTAAQAGPPPNWQQLYLQERAAHNADRMNLNATINSLNSRIAQLQGWLNAARQANSVLSSNLSTAQTALNSAATNGQSLRDQLNTAVAGLSAERGARQAAEQALAGEQQGRQAAEQARADERQGRQGAEQALADAQRRSQEFERAAATEQQKRQDAEQAYADEQQKRQDTERQLAEALKRLAELEPGAAPLPNPVLQAAPKPALHTRRYLRVQNDTGKALKVWLQFRTLTDAGQWTWQPVAPEKSSAAIAFDLAPGAGTDLTYQGRRVSASRVRIWAVADGASWLHNKDRDLWLVQELDERGNHVYSAQELQTYTLTFPPASP
jgi:hypothetical protein